MQVLEFFAVLWIAAASSSPMPERVVRSTTVSARNGGSDQKALEIPGNCQYLKHSTAVNEAEPAEDQRGREGGKWDYKEWVDRLSDGTIYRVSVWCWAERPGWFGGD